MTKFVFILIAISVSARVSFADESMKKALVIVDMQPFFVTRENADGQYNSIILHNLLEKQKAMIAKAKRTNMPILVVEYAGKYGKTNPSLISAIGDYKQVKTVQKTTVGLFDDEKSRQETQVTLKAWGVKGLVVMGANGGYCVKQTIRGALANGFKVWAYNDGIADFNFNDFVSPYPYRYDLVLRAAGLMQEQTVSQPIPQTQVGLR